MAKKKATKKKTTSETKPEINAQMVKELRDRTGAQMMKCKEALVETGGDMDAAVEVLRKKGISSGEKRAGRSTTEGAIGSYIHHGAKIGVMVEVNCETDFVARNEEFQAFIKDICMHVAAAAPIAVSRDEVSKETVAKERAIAEETVPKGKPENIIQKIVDGKMDKFFSEVCLMEQKFVKDDKMSVGEILKALIGKLGENMTIRRFVRWELGQE